MLFQWDLGKDSPGNVRELFWSNTRQDEEESLCSFANELFTGTVGAIEAIDGMIQSRAEHWRLERMAAVDRNILRIGVYELCRHPETPPAVVINEALEIARKFSGEDSVQFVNGILDRVRKEVEATRPG